MRRKVPKIQHEIRIAVVDKDFAVENVCRLLKGHENDSYVLTALIKM